MIKITPLLKLFFITFPLYITSSNFLIAESLSQEINFFRASPRLIDSNTSFKSTDVLSRYNFIIDIPDDAGNNLQRIVINQQSNLEIIDIYEEKTKVLILTDNGEINVENSAQFTINKSDNTSKIAIDLFQPIQAGSRIKVVLRARNPLHGGVYQFGITVYPEGNNPRSLYLGIARFHFYRHGVF